MLLKKSLTVIIKSIVLGLTVTYPFFVFFILQQHLSIRYLAGILLIIVGLSFIRHRKLFILCLGVLLSVLTVFTDQDIFAKLYPVLMNGSFCWLFTSSLFNHKPLINEIAKKISKHSLTPEKQQYMTRITTIWAIFLFINTIISLLTVFLSYHVWAIYNGFISYLLMGIIFIVEYLFRQKVLNVQPD